MPSTCERPPPAFDVALEGISVAGRRVVPLAEGRLPPGEAGATLERSGDAPPLAVFVTVRGVRIAGHGKTAGGVGAVDGIDQLGEAVERIAVQSGGKRLLVAAEPDVRVSDFVRALEAARAHAADVTLGLVEDDTGLETDPLEHRRAAYFRAHRGELASCYEAVLAQNPSRGGRRVVRFPLTASGRATDLSVEEDSLKDAALTACLLDRVSAWKFPVAPPEDVEVVHPLELRPAE